MIGVRKLRFLFILASQQYILERKKHKSRLNNKSITILFMSNDFMFEILLTSKGEYRSTLETLGSPFLLFLILLKHMKTIAVLEYLVPMSFDKSLIRFTVLCVTSFPCLIRTPFKYCWTCNSCPICVVDIATRLSSRSFTAYSCLVIFLLVFLLLSLIHQTLVV